MLFFLFIFTLTVSAQTTINSRGWYCSDADINKDFIVNELDPIQDFDMSGGPSSNDTAAYNFFLGCTYDPSIIIKIDTINISKKTDLSDIHDNIINNHGGTFAINATHRFSNGTTLAWLRFDTVNISQYLVNKLGECNYSFQGTFFLYDGADLLIDSCTLSINSSTSGQMGIKVYNGARLNITNSYLKPAGRSSYDFEVRPGSYLNIYNSTIERAEEAVGIGIPYLSSFTVGTDNAIIKNSRFISVGGIIIDKVKPTLENIEVRGSLGYNFSEAGLTVWHVRNLTVRNITINNYNGEKYTGYYGVILINASLNYVSGFYNATIAPLAYSLQNPFYEFNRQWYFQIIDLGRYYDATRYETYESNNLIDSGDFLNGQSNRVVLTQFKSYYSGGRPNRTNYTYFINLYDTDIFIASFPIKLTSDVYMRLPRKEGIKDNKFIAW